MMIVEVLLYVHTETEGLLGTGAQDVHLDVRTAPELCASACVQVSLISSGAILLRTLYMNTNSCSSCLCGLILLSFKF